MINLHQLNEGCKRRVISEAKGGATMTQWHPHDDDDTKGNFKTKSSKGYQPGKTVGWYPGCSCYLDHDRRCLKCKADWSYEEVESGNWQERKAAGTGGGDKLVGANRNHGKGISHDLPSKPTASGESEPPLRGRVK